MSELNYRLLQEEVLPETFDCGVDSINQYVYDSYATTLLQHGYAYRIVYEDISVGYYMIMFNMISILECPDEVSEYMCGVSNYISCIEIKYLAIGKQFQKKKIGTLVLRNIIKIIKDYVLTFPVRLIIIEARNDYVEWYKRMGFKKLPCNSNDENGYTTKMYIDLWLYREQYEKYNEQKLEEIG